MNTWNVMVEGYGYIGSVQEDSEENARCAALCKFSEDGERPEEDSRGAIYEDDVFSVSQA